MTIIQLYYKLHNKTSFKTRKTLHHIYQENKDLQKFTYFQSGIIVSMGVWGPNSLITHYNITVPFKFVRMYLIALLPTVMAREIITNSVFDS